jgi:hypothetical protein
MNSPIIKADKRHYRLIGMFVIINLSISLCAAMPNAQAIWVSSDSALVYNKPLSSIAGKVIFVNQSASSVHLDSTHVIIEEMDTVGLTFVLAHKALQTFWRAGNLGFYPYFIWSMDSVGVNDFRLKKGEFHPDTAVPLSFAAQGDTAEIFFLQIGFCFICDMTPVYPRHFKGIMKLYFSNGQTISLRLYTNDPLTPVRHTAPAIKKQQSAATGIRYLANGRQMPKITAAQNIRKNIRLKLFSPKEY